MAEAKTEAYKNRPPGSRFFYGWIIVGAAFVVLTIASGVIYAFPVFFEQVQTEFGASRAQVSLTFALCQFIWFAIGAISGPATDRFGPRAVIGAGICLVAGGLAAAGMAKSLPVLYLAYGLGVGVGGSFLYVPAISVVQRWFKKRRGLASGIAITGIGVGTLTFPLLAAALVQAHDWRYVHFAFGSITVVVGGIAALMFVSAPEAIDQRPDGAARDDSESIKAAAVGIELRAALRSKPFWYLFVASLTASSALFIVLVHLTPYATDHGHSKVASVALLSAIGTASIFGRFMFGGLADMIGRRLLLAVMYGLLAATMLWWLLAPPKLELLYAFAVPFGLFYGGYIALLPALAMDYFGGARISSIIGFMYTSAGFGALFGPSLAGLAHDLTQSYSIAIAGGAVLMLLASISCFLLKDPVRAF